MIMTMGRDYVSEIRPSTVHPPPQVRNEYGEPWWNDIGKGKVQIRPPKLTGNPTTRVI
jgi:hypothetical protein